jgi:sugar phosphate isomerase/epimerase
MTLILGADTLCWHQRLETADVTLEECLAEAAEAGARFVQLSLHHARDRSTEELPRLAQRAADLGLELLASGDPLDGAHRGEATAAAAARIDGWLERAAALGSPILRLASGFYRADLAARPGAIEAERAWTIEAIGAAIPAARAAGIVLAIENHSDFTLGEYGSILDAVPDLRVFLDLINPVSALEDPLHAVRDLAPRSVAGHIKDYSLESIWTEGRYHRRGFEVRWRYPGEGVADLPRLLRALESTLGGRTFRLSVEGLDNTADRRDQIGRLRDSFALVDALLAAEV